MTRIVNVPVFQGHPVPSRPHAPRGPFPPELYFSTGVETEYVEQSDSGEAELPPGATAQNGFTEVRFYRCKICEKVLRDSELEAHVCKE